MVGQGFVFLVAFFRMRELEQLNFLKLMLAEDAAGVFAGGSRFGAETSGPSGDVDGQLVFRNGLVAVEIVEFDLGRGSKPEVGAFQSKKIGGKFGQLGGAGERSAIHHERRKDLGVTVFAGMYVQEEVSQ